ncbi:hypothetical protein EI94DRAFT_1728838 [Lactarius quietus]|nr:hypothetical protein EI94DRAFT_1746785 [Lactarius quietus]KAF8267960.1 hypothetical protein EI94DRAFT_1728838 [Lactarius quietus]
MGMWSRRLEYIISTILCLRCSELAAHRSITKRVNDRFNRNTWNPYAAGWRCIVVSTSPCCSQGLDFRSTYHPIPDDSRWPY